MGDMRMEAEKYYCILKNDAGELLVMIKEKASEPEEPVLVYAGGDHALLYRNKDLIVILDFVKQAIRADLHQADQVHVVESGDDGIQREYDVPTRQVDQLPIPDDQLPKQQEESDWDTMRLEVEKQYDILQSPEGEIMVVIRARDAQPEDPLLEYAGGENALLYRDDDTLVVLTYVHPAVRGELYKADRVLIAEVGNGELQREYTVSIRHVDELSVTDKLISELEG